jgi:hypothetical protein
LNGGVKLSFFQMGALVGAIALTGCKSPPSEPLDVAAYRQAHPIRIEFVRPCRIYESGDALFAMVNDTRQLLWFLGHGPEMPVARLRAGAAGASEQEAVIPGRANKSLQRFPLAPRETRYFEIKTGETAGTIQIGMTFYNAFTSTNGIPVWSMPVTTPFK